MELFLDNPKTADLFSYFAPMQAVKKILLSILNLVAHGYVFHVLWGWSTRGNAQYALVYAMALIWLSMSVAFFQFHVTQIRFANSYYQDSPKRSRLYVLLGVRAFKWFLIRSPFRYLNQKLYLQASRPGLIRQLEEDTREAETAHTLGGLFCLGWAFALLLGRHPGSGWVLLWTLLFHAYPILLQRYTRIRLNRMLR